jgi:hypothetical protein
VIGIHGSLAFAAVALFAVTLVLTGIRPAGRQGHNRSTILVGLQHELCLLTLHRSMA